jgi:glycosyltransferase involved in cell wall biosynthesis
MQRSKSKVCLLINTISPARIPLYSSLAEQFDLLLLHGGNESNRDYWRNVEKGLPGARVKRAWGFQIPIMRRLGGRFFDYRFLHITPGYLWHLLTFRPEAVITNEMGLRTVIALTYGTLFRKPVWVWWGGTLHTERNLSVARKVVRRLISRWASRWISYGQTSTEYLLSLGINREQILEIQNAVDDRLFSVRSEPGFKLQPRPVLLYVGRLVARKGVELLIRAAAALQKEGLKFSTLLVGGGEDEKLLNAIAQDVDLRNMYFCAEQLPGRMPSVFRSGDVLIFPTLEDVWGLVANEAILSGLPVLCSKYAGCAPELFPPQNIFDPLDPQEFKEKIRAALEGRIAKPDPSRLRPSAQIANDLIRAVDASIRSTSSSAQQHEPLAEIPEGRLDEGGPSSCNSPYENTPRT